MATGSWPNIYDVTSRLDPKGDIPVIAEYLSQHNDYREDMPMKEANGFTFHEEVFRTSIPAGSWRQYNQGVPYGKSTTAKFRVGMAMLADWSQCDRSLARHSGNEAKFRESEDVAFLEGMSQTVAQTFVYGNTATNPAQFMGMANFYNTVNSANAQNALNVIDGLGTGTSNTSIYAFGWGEETIFGIYPRGSKAGLNWEDQGTTVPAFDSLGNRFPAYTSYFEEEIGVCPKDWRWGGRIPNLDTTAVGLAGSNPADLFLLIRKLLMNFPTGGRTTGITKTDAPHGDPAVRIVLYMDRTARFWLDIQAIRNRNVLLPPDQSAGRAWSEYDGVPIKVIDQIVNTEARVV